MYSSIIDVAKRVEEQLSESIICKEEGRRVERLLKKVEQKNVTIAVLGQFKRGKSTLMNAILGEKVLPVGIVPITSVVTSVHYGGKRAEVIYNNGKKEITEFALLPSYISEQKNMNNSLGVNHVDIYIKNEFLRQGVTFVDTPGVGSYHTHNTDVAYAFMKESDAVIFLLSVDSPINQIEIEFLKNAKAYASKFYFAINKVDIIDQEELEEYMAYCKNLLIEIMDSKEIQIFPVSGKTQIGIESLINSISEDIKEEADGILETSLRMKLMDIIKEAIAHLNLNWKALNMPWGELTVKFQVLSEHIEKIKNHSKILMIEGNEQTNYKVAINEYKLGISEKILEQFDMEYIYPIKPIEDVLEAKDQRVTFEKEVKELCDDIEATLKTAVMYKEENAYTVIKHINKINRLTKNLRKILNLISTKDI